MNTSLPIVILHGWGLTAAHFKPLQKVFDTQSVYTIAFDLPGFGTELPPSTVWGVDDYANFVHTCLQKKKITRCIIIGHSFGGRIALRMSALYASDIAAFVLTGTPGYSPVPLVKRVVSAFLGKFVKKIFLLGLSETAGEQGIRMWYRLMGVKDYTNARGILKDIFKKVVQQDLVESMRQVKVPCLLLWGQHDGIVPLRIAQKMHQTIPGSELVVIADSRHNVPYIFPEKFAKEVLQFCKRQHISLQKKK